MKKSAKEKIAGNMTSEVASKGGKSPRGSTKEHSIRDILKIRQRKAILRAERIGFLVKILVLAAMIALILLTIFGVTVIKGNDMAPALKDGDIAIYFRLGREYNTSDVVVYREETKTRVGRVIGHPGTKLGKTSGGLLLIDGRIHPIQKQNGLFYDTKAGNKIKYPLTIGEGKFFILGDRRDTATDSRTFGPIDKKNIKGKVFTFLRKRGI